MTAAWRNFIDYASSKNVHVRRSGRLPEWEMWHEKDHGDVHNVDTLSEAVESLSALVMAHSEKTS